MDLVAYFICVAVVYGQIRINICALAAWYLYVPLDSADNKKEERV